MKTVTESVTFNHSAKVVWEIISDISRSDWLQLLIKSASLMIAESLRWTEWAQ